MATRKKGITVVGVEAENFRRLTFARFTLSPEAGLVRVSGRNGAGKTSLLRMVREGFGGAGEVLPEAVHVSSATGKGGFALQLSNGFSIEKRYTASAPKGYLTLVGPDGGKHGQKKLDGWLGPLSFDPLSFFGLHRDRQREILLSLGRDPDLAAKLAELRRLRKEKYEERTPWISQKRRHAQVPTPPGERPQPVDVSAEMRRLGELQVQERARGDARRALADARRKAEAAEAAAGNAKEQIEELERRLVQARENLHEAEGHRSRTVARADEAQAAFDALADPEVEMEAVRSRLTEADAVGRSLEPWRAWDRAQEDGKEAAAAVEALTAQMDLLEEREEKLLAEAGIPVPGISFAEGGSPLLNGHSLEVASGAERIRLAVDVAIAADPELRVCLLDEANDLDLEGLQALDALAKEHGFQIWAARLGLEGDGEICVEDGVARARDAKPAGAAVS